MQKKPVFIGTLLNVLPVFLALLVPIFFLPLTTEFFEFNKLALIVVGTILMVLLWVGKMLYDKKVEIAKSPVDFSILTAFGVILLSTIFSLHKVSSVFGAQGRWFPSLFGVITLFLFYYVVATNISTIKVIKRVIDALIAGITISSIVAVLSYAGVAFGTAVYLQIPNFTLTGSTAVATVLAALGVSLALSKIVSNTTGSLKMAYVGSIVVNFSAVVLMGVLPAWVSLITGLLVIAYFADSRGWVENKATLGLVGIFVVAILVTMYLPSSRAALVNENYPNEVTLSAKESWLVVSSIIRDFPLLGTGPSTFGLNYTRYKPLSVNTQDYWNLRFDKPFSEAFAVIGALGIVGVAVMLGFVIKTLRFSLGTKEQVANNATSMALSVGFATLLVAMFVTYATVTTGFLLVLFLALTTAKARLESESNVSLASMSLSSLSKGSGMSLSSGDNEVFQYIVAVPLVALAVTGGYLLTKQMTGEVYMRKAILAAQENNGSLTYQFQQKAIEANPQRDTFHSSYANTNLALANTLASVEEVSEEERATIQALISQAIRSSRVTTEVLNPLSSSNWETRANIYRSLVGVADDAGDWSVRSFNTAVQLDPVNPRLRLSLGGIYYASGDFLSAANLFNQAVSLKGDYANAHYNLAQALKQLDRPEQAIRELETVKRLVEPASSDYERVAAEINSLSLDPTVAGISDKPSVEELGATLVEEPVVQEPLTNVGEDEVVETTGDLDLGETVVDEGEEATPSEPSEE